MPRSAALVGLATALLSQAAQGAESIQPVQVYILMGQSNMVGMGNIVGTKNGTLEFAVHTEGKYPYLWDNTTNAWAVRNDVRYAYNIASGNVSFNPSQLLHNEWMTVNSTKQSTMGTELGIGKAVGDFTDGPVLILKSCIGNRALGWDLMPPGTKGFDYEDQNNVTWTYAAYHESPQRWQKGTTPVPMGWEAGEQYDGDTDRAAAMLADISTYYPGATDYEVKGFFWWQGDRDSKDYALAGRYEHNLVNLIRALRQKFKAPNANFVTASLGQTVMGDTDGGGLVLDAMLEVDGTSGKYPEFKGTVKTVYSHPYSMGGVSGSHYGQNAETYMNVGQAMGAAMVELLKAQQ